jgi:hypothetical protein
MLSYQHFAPLGQRPTAWVVVHFKLENGEVNPDGVPGQYRNTDRSNLFQPMQSLQESGGCVFRFVNRNASLLNKSAERFVEQ